ncbi:hypothetical protein MFIFM68171_05607 [Madurella fahalii]|uniref:Ferric oxidoreductase domain-containing protein n=1 Tax=Madurella fahalii TaxID=1157608 RepID=A0ABQ0GCA6_9PEZI
MLGASRPPGITSAIDDPACAYACTRSLANLRLEYSVDDYSDHGGQSHGPPIYTSPECRANDNAYLTSLAWCLSTKCAEYEVATSRLEAIWEHEATGDASVPAKWSYTEELLNVADPPTRQLVTGDTFNTTSIAPEYWETVYNTAIVMAHESTMQSTYGLILLLAGFAVLIVLILLGYLPWMNTVQDKIGPYVVYSGLIGKYHVRPLPFLLGNAPTVGQALLIALLVVLNVLVTAIGYRSAPSHLWLLNQWQQTVGFLMYRTGVLSYAMAPLVILFAGRNNILLWLTNWSHSTYLLLHRWVSRLFYCKLLLHSVIAVILDRDLGIYDAQA